jgi:hypothetical protein
MDSIRILLSRCWAFFCKEKLDEDLDEELRTHIDFAVAENLKRGVDWPWPLSASMELSLTSLRSATRNLASGRRCELPAPTFCG